MRYATVFRASYGASLILYEVPEVILVATDADLPIDALITIAEKSLTQR